LGRKRHAYAGRPGGGVQSVGTVLSVLRAFIGSEPMPMLKSLAERAGMHPAKVHRYLASLCKTGYVRQDPDSGRYRLGPATLRLGHAALNAIPVVRIARPLLKTVSESHECSVFVALWSDGGPRIVLQETQAAPIVVAAHVGSVFPLLTSATGRTFAAWLPRSQTEALLNRELSLLKRKPVPSCPTTLAEADVMLEGIRRRGLARATGQLSAAIHGLSAPVFDKLGSICAVVTMLGPAGQFDTRWTGSTARSVLETASTITIALKEAEAATR